MTDGPVHLHRAFNQQFPFQEESEETACKDIFSIYLSVLVLNIDTKNSILISSLIGNPSNPK